MFRAVFDHATVGIALGTLDGRCLRANKAACEFIGATEEEVRRLSIQKIVHPEDLALTADVFPRLLAGELPSYTVERRYVRRDATIVWGRATVSVVRDRGGKPLYLVGVMVDVTHEKLVEKQQAAFSRLGHGLSGAVTSDQAGQIILDVASQLFGWDAGFFHLYSEKTGEVRRVLTMDTVGGRRTLFPETQTSEPSPIMRRVMQEGGQLINRGNHSESTTELEPFGDEPRRSASRMFVPVRTGGVVVGILSIQSYTPGAYGPEDLKLLQTLADLCGGALERIKLTDALGEAEAKYRSIFNNATEGMYQTSREGRFMSANPALAGMFGYETPEEMIASISDIGRQTYVVLAKREEYLKLLEGRHAVQHFETEFYRKDGSVFWASLYAHAVRDGSGKVLYYEGTCHDITEVVRAREALARSHDELERVVRERTAELESANESLRKEMADRERLERQVLEGVEREQQRIGQDIHDGLCQLLAGVKFKAASLRAKVEPQLHPEAKEFADIEELVNEAIRQGYGLARGLNPVKLPTHGLRSALKELAASIEAAFGVKCVCDFRPPAAISDPTVANHLYRIAQEAIHNAIKHGKARTITVLFMTEAGKLVLTIQDDGAGIAQEWTPGMGLQNMKTRAQMIGATLEIHAGARGGTVVACSLPISNPPNSSG